MSGTHRLLIGYVVSCIDVIVLKGIKAICCLSRIVSIPLKCHGMSLHHHYYLSSIIKSIFGHASKGA